MTQKNLKISVAGQRDEFLPSSQNFGWPSPKLYVELELSGFRLTEDLDGDIFLCIDHNALAYKKFIERGNRKEKCILIRTEPESVYPAQYKSRIENLYGLVISPGLVAENFKKAYFVPHPYTFQANHGGPSFFDPSMEMLLNDANFKVKFDSKNWDARNKEIVMLASNKFSPVKDSGYAIRRRIAVDVQTRGIVEIHGMYWQSPLFYKINLYLRMLLFNIKSGYLPYFNLDQLKRIESQNLKGCVNNKYQLISDTKYLLIVENSKNCITEKIFDAFLCGAIPIYCGPNLSKVGIPSSAYIKLDWDLSNLKDVITSLKSLQPEDYLNSIIEFIKKDEFLGFWLEESVYKKISSQIFDFSKINN